MRFSFCFFCFWFLLCMIPYTRIYLSIPLLFNETTPLFLLHIYFQTAPATATAAPGMWYYLYGFFTLLLSRCLFLLIVAVGSTVDEARKKRWDGLNAVLDINKKARIKDGHMSLGYSYANWEQEKSFFHLVTGNLQTTAGDGLPQPLLTALHQYLSFATICHWRSRG